MGTVERWCPFNFKMSENNLSDVVRIAASACNWDGEEEGGIILQNEDTGEFRFVKLRNQNTGTPIAGGLYTVDREEYGDKIIPLFNDGWLNYASFHTHPDGCAARPSLTDLNKLFKGFQINYIYSPWSGEINSYTKEALFDDPDPSYERITHEDAVDTITWVKQEIQLKEDASYEIN